MMRSMFAGVSGLRNHLVRMDVVGNNIANVNTTGFKASRVTFQDMLSQVLRSGTSPVAGGTGGTNPAQIGLGMVVGGIDTLQTQGNLSATGKVTDMAIQGNGFFVLSNGINTFYSRDGVFDIGLDGNLTNPTNGFRVQGWNADVNGVLDTTQTVGNINIPIGQTDIAQATAMMKLAGNIDASGVQATQGSVAISGALYATADQSAVASGATLLTSLYDGSGNALLAADDVLTLSGYKGGGALSAASRTVGAAGFTTYADVLNWSREFFGIASGESYDYNSAAVNSGVDIDATVAGAMRLNGNKGQGNALTNITLRAVNSAGVDKTQFNNVMDNLATTQQDADGTSASTTMTVYDSQGVPHSMKLIFTRVDNLSNTWSWTADSADDVSGGRCVTNDGAMKSITFSSSGAYSAKTGSVSIDLLSAAPMAFDPDMSVLTQFSGSSSVSLSEQDGYPKGTLDKFSVGSDGTITGIYTNGLTQAVGQIALATFANASGLITEGNNLLSQSTNSGAAQLGAPGSSGRGIINNGFLEMSNVDLAQSFTDIIITQRGFQANARTITTSDDMLQELVALKR